MSSYPNNKDKFNKATYPKPDALGLAVNEMLQECIVVGSLGLWVLIKSIFSKWFAISLAIIGGELYCTFRIASVGDHIVWLQKSDPDLFTPERLEWYES